MSNKKIRLIRLEENDLNDMFGNFMEGMEDLREQVPQEFRASIEMETELTTSWEVPIFNLEIFYWRPFTEKEQDEENARQALFKNEKQNKILRQIERLENQYKEL